MVEVVPEGKLPQVRKHRSQQGHLHLDSRDILEFQDVSDLGQDLLQPVLL